MASVRLRFGLGHRKALLYFEKSISGNLVFGLPSVDSLPVIDSGLLRVLSCAPDGGRFNCSSTAMSISSTQWAGFDSRRGTTLHRPIPSRGAYIGPKSEKDVLGREHPRPLSQSMPLETYHRAKAAEKLEFGPCGDRRQRSAQNLVGGGGEVGHGLANNKVTERRLDARPWLTPRTINTE